MGLEWMSRAACRNADPESFFPVGKGGPADEQVAYVRENFCDRCGVSGKCLSFALENHVNDGVFGGLTGEERESLKRRQSRARARARGDDEAGPPVRKDLLPIERAAKVIEGSGLKNFEIAALTGMHEGTVSRLRRRSGEWVEPSTLDRLEAALPAAAVTR